MAGGPSFSKELVAGEGRKNAPLPPAMGQSPPWEQFCYGPSGASLTKTDLRRLLRRGGGGVCVGLSMAAFLARCPPHTHQ